MGCSPRWQRCVVRLWPDDNVFTCNSLPQVVPSVSISYVVYEHTKRRCVLSVHPLSFADFMVQARCIK